MTTFYQLLSAPIKFPVSSAAEEEKKVFADKPESKKGVFYHIALTSGQSFVGLLCPDTQRAFFRPTNNLEDLPDLKEIQYEAKYFYNRPEQICQLVLSDDCPQDRKNLYHTLFDSQSVNFSNPDLAHFKNHALGQFTKKAIPTLRQIESAKRLQISGQKELQSVLTGLTQVQQKQPERI